MFRYHRCTSYICTFTSIRLPHRKPLLRSLSLRVWSAVVRNHNISSYLQDVVERDVFKIVPVRSLNSQHIILFTQPEQTTVAYSLRYGNWTTYRWGSLLKLAIHVSLIKSDLYNFFLSFFFSLR